MKGEMQRFDCHPWDNTKYFIEACASTKFEDRMTMSYVFILILNFLIKEHKNKKKHNGFFLDTGGVTWNDKIILGGLRCRGTFNCVLKKRVISPFQWYVKTATNDDFFLYYHGKRARRRTSRMCCNCQFMFCKITKPECVIRQCKCNHPVHFLVRTTWKFGMKSSCACGTVFLFRIWPKQGVVIVLLDSVPTQRTSTPFFEACETQITVATFYHDLRFGRKTFCRGWMVFTRLHADSWHITHSQDDTYLGMSSR